jgi:hypothetical protein
VPEFEFGSEESEREIIFKPNPGPQTEFLAASEREVLYGGSAGGEPKSWFYRLLSRVIWSKQIS